MLSFLQIFNQQIYNQYLIIGVAVLIVISIKLYMANKAYQKKLVSFIHPDTVLQDLKKKVKSVDQAQNLLAFNIHKVSEDESRMRNIAFLMALLKSHGVSLKPLKQKIQQTFKQIDMKNYSKANKTYKQYILNEIEAECNPQSKKKQQPFYTV